MAQETTDKPVEYTGKHSGVPMSEADIKAYERTWRLMDNLEIIEEKPKCKADRKRKK